MEDFQHEMNFSYEMPSAYPFKLYFEKPGIDTFSSFSLSVASMKYCQFLRLFCILPTTTGVQVPRIFPPNSSHSPFLPLRIHLFNLPLEGSV